MCRRNHVDSDHNKASTTMDQEPPGDRVNTLQVYASLRKMENATTKEHALLRYVCIENRPLSDCGN